MRELCRLQEVYNSMFRIYCLLFRILITVLEESFFSLRETLEHRDQLTSYKTNAYFLNVTLKSLKYLSTVNILESNERINS